jgi:di/tricarboxylate transporter
LKKQRKVLYRYSYINNYYFLRFCIDYKAFAVVVMIAASANLMTPTDHKANLMVMGPSGYRFSDYVKVGAPLSVLVAVMALLLVPLVWPLV